MFTLNIVGMQKLRDPEFLANVEEVYGNEFFVVVKHDDPYLLGFPVQVLERFQRRTGFENVRTITRREIQRGELFGNGTGPEHGTVYVLGDRNGPAYAFALFTPFKTYPAIAEIFKDGKLFNDHIWEYYKPRVPPLTMAGIMRSRAKTASEPLKPLKLEIQHGDNN